MKVGVWKTIRIMCLEYPFFVSLKYWWLLSFTTRNAIKGFDPEPLIGKWKALTSLIQAFAIVGGQEISST